MEFVLVGLCRGRGISHDYPGIVFLCLLVGWLAG